MERERTGEVRLGEVVPQPERLEVRVEQRTLSAELLANHLLDDSHVNVEQRHERAGIRNVAHQLTLAIALERLGAQLPERNA